MNFISSFRLAMVALVPAAAISLGLGGALAQTPPPAPPAASAPATPAPAPSATPAPPPAETKSPADIPSAAQTPVAPPPAPVQTADPFGEQITLDPKTVVVLRGTANWD
jgi:hypothetical protein